MNEFEALRLIVKKLEAIIEVMEMKAKTTVNESCANPSSVNCTCWKCMAKSASKEGCKCERIITKYGESGGQWDECIDCGKRSSKEGCANHPTWCGCVDCGIMRKKWEKGSSKETS